MSIFRRARLAPAMFMTVIATSAWGAEKPVPAPANVPDLRAANTVIVCVGCDEPFSTGGHKELLAGLLSNQYIAQLRKALYLQDSYHQFESKVHFDNCDFENGQAYIVELLEETDGHVREAQMAKAAHDATKMRKSVEAAFFALGQALHGVQDFYAHSNYIELQTPKVQEVTDLDIIPTWTAIGGERILALQKEGLVSGYVWWGLPQKCSSDAVTHENLAKDSAQTVSGKRVVAHLKNLNQYKIAIFLAREGSLKFLTYAFKRWPLLKELNGENVAFEVLVDRRTGLE